MTYQIDNKKIAKNTIALYVRMGFTMIVSFFATRVTLQVLGVNDFGLNNLVSSIVALFSFLNASLGTAVQRFYSIEIGKNNKTKLKQTFGCALSMHLIVAIITSLFMEVFALIFLNKLNIPIERQNAAQIVFQISIISLFLNIISVPYSAILRSKEKFSEIATIDILQAIFRLSILYLLYIINYDKLITLSLLNLLVTLFYVTSIIYLARKDNICHILLCWDKNIINEMIKFISMLIVTILASLFRDKGIIILINIYFGLTINAAYGIAMQVMTLTNTFVTNFKQSLIPQMVASYGHGDILTMQKLINIGTKITFLLMLAISVPVIFEIDYLLKLWLDNPPQYSSKLVILSLINVNISSFTYFLYQGVHATGNITRQQICFSLLYLINIILIYILFELNFDFYYALYSTIFISIIQCLTNVIIAKNTFKYNVKEFICNILPKCVLIIMIYLFIYTIICDIVIPSFYRLIISVLLSLLLTIITGLYLLLNNNERNSIINFILNRNKS